MKLRSLLYVPAHSERFIAKAHERGADALILDLEDAVPDAEKDAARAGLTEAIARVGRNGTPVFVRVNVGERQDDDALAACRAGAVGLVVPKAESADVLSRLAELLAAEEARLGRAEMGLITTIESPAGLLDAREIARVPRVLALHLGSEDFVLATGGAPTPDVLRLPKLLVHYAAKAEGKLSLGLLQSIADYQDVAGLERATAEARSHGFDGATCVHPAVVPVLNAGFDPTEAEREWARGVLAAAEGRGGPFAHSGRMVDLPVLMRARRILE
jgi:citrate lyase subunit beta / citryl-CoA lyase